MRLEDCCKRRLHCLDVLGELVVLNLQGPDPRVEDGRLLVVAGAHVEALRGEHVPGDGVRRGHLTGTDSAASPGGSAGGTSRA